MHRAFRLPLAACLFSAAALGGGCSGTDKNPGETGGAGGEPWGGSGGTGGAGGAAMGMIPDPGSTVGGEWTDVEPNDKPSQAVPVGIVEGPIWMGFASPVTAMSSPADVDYFVFRTGADATLANVNIQTCWSFPGNLLDLNLYEVVQSQKGPLVKSATTTNTSCETVIGFGEGTMVLKADTIYLLEVIAGPGLDLAGDPGLYSA
jgi:hypothetical protein